MIKDAMVKRVVDQIARAVQPERIFLFGSRANGTAGPDSDIDLVVLYSGPKSKRELSLDIHRLFPHPDFSMDLFVMRPEELHAQRHIANSLAREISERGVVCYG